MAGEVYYYISGEFWDDKRMRQSQIFWGPMASLIDAQSYAFKALTSKQNSNWKIVESEHADRDEARREHISSAIIAGGDITMVGDRLGKKTPPEAGEIPYISRESALGMRRPRARRRQ